MPDQPSPRRRFQFRLRTLLIGVTLAAVACCVVVDRQQLMRERDEAVRQQDTMKRDFGALKSFADDTLSDVQQELEQARLTSKQQRQRIQQLEAALNDRK
jgi:hypothetical protein